MMIFNNNKYKLKIFSLNRYYRKFLKLDLKLSNYLNEIIIGCLLGDLTAERKNKNCNTRLQFKQSIINIDYINHLYELFKDYCGTPPKTLSKFDKRPNKMKIYNAIKFQTLSLPCFNIYKELFYNSEGIKIIPSNIEELLTPISLAYWIMDDGYKFNKALYISTESFKQNDLILLTKILKKKFNLESSIHKTTNGYRIYIFSTSKEKLINLVKPYFIIHFYYKLGLISNINI